jgi:amino acid transporter
MNHSSQEERNVPIAIIAIVAALGLLGVVVVTVAVTVSLQQAEATQPPGRGCEFTPGGNASQGRCVH